MAVSYDPIRIDSSEWTDIVSVNGSLASVALTVQNIGSRDVQVFFGGVSEPNNSSGNVLGRREGINGTAANIWVKGLGGFSVAPIAND